MVFEHKRHFNLVSQYPINHAYIQCTLPVAYVCLHAYINECLFFSPAIGALDVCSLTGTMSASK